MGIAQGAMDRTLAYAKQREQFGRKIALFQSLRHKIAEMALKIELARGIVYGAACARDRKNKTATLPAMAMEFCRTRPRNGKPLSKHQSVHFALVEMATEVEIQKNFAYVLINDHMAGKQVIKETCMAKYRMTEMSKVLASRCMDIMGSDSALESHELTRMFRDARVTSIFAGTNEIMKTIIAKTMGL